MLWRKPPRDIAKVGVEGSNPFARSSFQRKTKTCEDRLRRRKRLRRAGHHPDTTGRQARVMRLWPLKQLTLDSRSSAPDPQRKLADQQLGIGRGWSIREASAKTDKSDFRSPLPRSLAARFRRHVGSGFGG